jgi:acyl-CoA synthetase (AMP-forming)/AMP-acid ligase II
MEDLAYRAWDGRTANDLPSWRCLRTDNFLATSAARRPAKEAIRFEGRSMTYGELDALAHRSASGLIELGIRPGDVVGVMAENSAEVFGLLYGIVRAGAAVLPLNPKYTRDEVDHQVRQAGAKVLVAPGHVEMEDVFAKGGDEPVEIEFDENLFFHKRFTSGTTGKPKMIATTHRAIALMHEQTARELSYVETDVALVAAPVAHAAFHLAAATIASGGTILLHRTFDPKTVWEECDRHGVTTTFMAPTMFAISLDSPGTGETLRQFFVTSASFPPALKAKVRKRFPQADIYECYGSTEVGLATLLRPSDPSDKQGSVGLPGWGYQVRVLDPDGQDCPPGEVGEIYTRGPSMSFGYIGEVEMRDGQAVDGWVSAGDLGSLDEDGYLYVADRRDDLIVSGGLNVYPAEVEDVLLRLEGVREVAVVGVPDETWGHVVVAAVCGDVAPEELDAHCRGVLARYKVPRRYEFVGELPKNLSGKILRRAIREDLAARATT